MASKRHIRRRACEGKRKFESQEAAIANIRRRVAITQGGLGGKLTPYHCKTCGGYHIGHPPPGVLK